jgi:hypothetical protein
MEEVNRPTSRHLHKKVTICLTAVYPSNMMITLHAYREDRCEIWLVGSNVNLSTLGQQLALCLLHR